MADFPYNSKLLAKHRFYREPPRNKNKVLSPCQTTTRGDYTPDELEYEDRQDCEMQPGEELPF